MKTALIAALILMATACGNQDTNSKAANNRDTSVMNDNSDHNHPPVEGMSNDSVLNRSDTVKSNN